jgi:hypothetical protein
MVYCSYYTSSGIVALVCLPRFSSLLCSSASFARSRPMPVNICSFSLSITHCASWGGVNYRSQLRRSGVRGRPAATAAFCSARSQATNSPRIRAGRGATGQPSQKGELPSPARRVSGRKEKILTMPLGRAAAGAAVTSCCRARRAGRIG